jgi:hypothetical protein
VSWWQRLRTALGREAAEAKDVYRQAEQRLDAELSRREAELAETPEQKLARMTEEIESGPDPFDEVRARLDRMRAAGESPAPTEPPPGEPPATPPGTA